MVFIKPTSIASVLVGAAALSASANGAALPKTSQAPAVVEAKVHARDLQAVMMAREPAGRVRSGHLSLPEIMARRSSGRKQDAGVKEKAEKLEFQGKDDGLGNRSWRGQLGRRGPLRAERDSEEIANANMEIQGDSPAGSHDEMDDKETDFKLGRRRSHDHDDGHVVEVIEPEYREGCRITGNGDHVHEHLHARSHGVEYVGGDCVLRAGDDDHERIHEHVHKREETDPTIIGVLQSAFSHFTHGLSKESWKRDLLNIEAHVNDGEKAISDSQHFRNGPGRPLIQVGKRHSGSDTTVVATDSRGHGTTVVDTGRHGHGTTVVVPGGRHRDPADIGRRRHDSAVIVNKRHSHEHDDVDVINTDGHHSHGGDTVIVGSDSRHGSGSTVVVDGGRHGHDSNTVVVNNSDDRSRHYDHDSSTVVAGKRHSGDHVTVIDNDHHHHGSNVIVEDGHHRGSTVLVNGDRHHGNTVIVDKRHQDHNGPVRVISDGHYYRDSNSYDYRPIGRPIYVHKGHRHHYRGQAPKAAVSPKRKPVSIPTPKPSPLLPPVVAHPAPPSRPTPTAMPELVPKPIVVEPAPSPKPAPPPPPPPPDADEPQPAPSPAPVPVPEPEPAPEDPDPETDPDAEPVAEPEPVEDEPEEEGDESIARRSHDRHDDNHRHHYHDDDNRVTVVTRSKSSDFDGAPGYIDVTSPIFNSTTAQRIASLVLSTSNGSDVNSTFVLNASNNVRTQVYLVPINSTSSSNSTSNATAPANSTASSASMPSASSASSSSSPIAVNLKLPIFVASSASVEPYCATFDRSPDSPAPMSVIPCTTTPDPTAHTSQVFLYSPETGVIQPDWTPDASSQDLLQSVHDPIDEDDDNEAAGKSESTTSAQSLPAVRTSTAGQIGAMSATSSSAASTAPASITSLAASSISAIASASSATSMTAASASVTPTATSMPSSPVTTSSSSLSSTASASAPASSSASASASASTSSAVAAAAAVPSASASSGSNVTLIFSPANPSLSNKDLGDDSQDTTGAGGDPADGGLKTKADDSSSSADNLDAGEKRSATAPYQWRWRQADEADSSSTTNVA